MTAPVDWREGTPRLVRKWRDALEDGSGRDLLILVDGLGFEALERARAHARFFRAHAREIERETTIAPATTTSVLASLFTGLAPLSHGILGYEGLTASGSRVNNLTGAKDLGPREWIRVDISEQRQQRRVAHVGPARYRTSFLTGMLQPAEHWDFFGYSAPGGRIGALRKALAHVGENGACYLHVPEIDKAGHRYGPGSTAWLDALEDTDRFLSTLMRALPPRTRVSITADHGMVPANFDHIADLAHAPAPLSRCTGVAGEGRALMVRFNSSDGCPPLADLRDWVGERGLVLDAEQMLSSGLLGNPRFADSRVVHERVGDALIFARGRHQFTHTGFVSAASLEQRGVHGSLSEAELFVPFLQIEV